MNPSLNLFLNLLKRAKSGHLTVTLPDGKTHKFANCNGGENDGTTLRADLQLHNSSLIRKVLAGGQMGFAESYMDGDWSSKNLTNLLRYFAANYESMQVGGIGKWLPKLINRIGHALNRNTREGARKNILAHYDISNAFYESWLDPSMTYSSAIYEKDGEALEVAQSRKYHAIAQKIGLNEKSHVLEIGCGWGGFAEIAAKEYGAKVTGLTLSNAQHEYASARMQREGLNEKVTLKIQDYRDENGQYDGIASIEMFEAVGESYWPQFFKTVFERLKPGSKAALQIITIDDSLFEAYRKGTDFIQKYVFPGGMLPSIERLKHETLKAGLSWNGHANFAQSYARTLAMWSKRFNAQFDKFKNDDLDERFKRLWNYYLSYCEAGFLERRIDVGQYTLLRDV